METKVYFENIENIILDELSKSKYSIKLVVAWLTNKKLFAKLVELAEKGITVNVVINNDVINKDSFLDYSRLNIGKSYLKMTEAKNGNILHHKFCIIDDNTVINGSYNWTYRANHNNENINIISDNKELTIKYIKEFSDVNNNSVQVKYTNSTLSNNANNSFQNLEDEEWKWRENECKIFEEWKNSQVINDNQFIDYLYEYLEHHCYGDQIDGNVLEIELIALINFLQNQSAYAKHTPFLKFILYNIFSYFRRNITNFDYKVDVYFKGYEGVLIRPYFNDKIKDIIYQDRFTKSINAYSYKIGLIFVMLDYAYNDYAYNGLLIDIDYQNMLMDYTKEPKHFSTNMVEIYKFIKELKKEDLNLKEKDGLLLINNCIRYFSNGYHRNIEMEPITAHVENEWFAFGVHLKSIGTQRKDCFIGTNEYNELINNYLNTENEFEDVIIKISQEKFNKIIHELEMNGLKNSFPLTKIITEIILNIDLDFITNEDELKLLIQNFVSQKEIIVDIQYNKIDNTSKVTTIKWDFEKSKEDIQKEKVIIHYLWLTNNYDFESVYDIWSLLEKEHTESKFDIEDYIFHYKIRRYLKDNNITIDELEKQEKTYQIEIVNKALTEVEIPVNFPKGFNLLKLFNSLKVISSTVNLSNEIFETMDINKDKALGTALLTFHPL